MGHRRGVFAAAAGLAMVLFTAGCGSHSPSTQASPPGARTSAANRSSSAIRTASVAEKAMATSRLIAQAVADQSSTKMLSLLSYAAGPVMPSYLRMQALWDEINAAAGPPSQPGSVTSVADGFQVCYAQQGGCQSLTDFHRDSVGRITDFAVDGELISPRLAVGGTYSGSALTFSSVYSYLETAYGETTVVFEAKNTSGHALGSAKQLPFLPVFVTPGGTQVPYDTDRSTVSDGSFPPGAVTAGVLVFDTTAFTGQFILRASNANVQPLAEATLRKPGSLTVLPDTQDERLIRLLVPIWRFWPATVASGFADPELDRLPQHREIFSGVEQFS
jgi:hypothetical protein